MIRELDPSPDLVAALDSVTDGVPTVVWIDQAELLLQERYHPNLTLQALVTLATGDDRAGCHIVIALRSDFQNLFEPYPALMGLIDHNVARIGPLDPAAQRAIIERPAAAAGLRIQEGLVAKVLRAVGPDPAALPLLAFGWRRPGSCASTTN